MKSPKFYLVALAVVFTMSTMAQNTEKRFGFELSGGASQATSKLADTELNTGFGFEGVFHYRFMEHIGAYAGWGWNKFSADESFAGTDMDIEETGYVFGLQFKHPIGATNLSYYGRAAGLYNHIEIENADGDIVKDSKHGFGYQLAGGLDIDLGSNWSLTPGVKFNSLIRSTDYEGSDKRLNLNYLSIRVGILKKF